MTRRKKKYESGMATTYITRNQALRKLQLSLADFRRLCILKGIYPQEPRNKKKAGKGSAAPKTYYYMKDIQFLLHEPIIKKFREFKHFVRKLRKAIDHKDGGAIRRLRQNKPKYKLDKIVKERYPTFIDAVRDLDDCVSMSVLFSTFPKTKTTASRQIELCRRLTVEFMHYVIASKSLRKVFVSIKGIYYQAEIMGQTVTWITPHKFGHEPPTEVDFKIMSTFVEFYTTMMGFVNYKLYSTMNLFYPPKLELESHSVVDDLEKCAEDERRDERLAAMTQTLESVATEPEEEEIEIDEFPMDPDDPDRIEQAKIEQAKLKKLQQLFKGCKFFLNREVPRESLTFIIRSFGGQVSWHSTVAIGATYEESDETITHQIVDRPEVPNQYLSRYYIQPQWVFDSVNARTLLPVEDYFPGVILPPHLSPFVEEEEGDYVPPEKQKMLDRERGVDSGVGEGEESDGGDEDEDSGEEDDEQSEEEEDQEESEDEEEESEDERPMKGKKRLARTESQKIKSSKKMKMAVSAGQIEVVDVDRKLKKQQDEEKRLAEMMIPKKKKYLYDKIIYGKKRKAKEARKLKEKREAYDKEQRQQRKKRKLTA